MPTPAPASEDLSASRPIQKPTGVPGPVPGQGEW
ncbi:TRM1 tRNA methyltransferase 1 homolog (S. cerevisiae), isoform CRA_e [Rattus norvegicus]|uniref:TRM1 tRNA methyltransferase 1 homolog (S. cerevisiae), isoform CRA_e n=1 Tax=Rattus norvegicus TaxID=10116 RepID=A6IY82_RAT|nr:TRM1 tRNA methyltransferase 1 homolog (S. cerevisiae), isoform CRA_e [Rattus norvegicus]